MIIQPCPVPTTNGNGRPVTTNYAMPRRFFRRISAEFLREKDYPWYLRPFEVMLRHPTFFAVSRRSVAGAAWLGLFIALLPIPAQTVVAPLAALLFRVNVPVAFAAVWITNPITWVPVYFFEYRLGLLILDLPPQAFNIELSWRWVLDDLPRYWRPLFLGSLVTATVVASTAYVFVSVGWRLAVNAKYRRRQRRQRSTTRASSQLR